MNGIGPRRVAGQDIAQPVPLPPQIILGKDIRLIGPVASDIEHVRRHDIVEKMGSWYSFEGERLGQGREKVKAFLQENPKVLKTMVEKVYAHAGLTPPTKKVALPTDKVTDTPKEGAKGKK